MLLQHDFQFDGAGGVMRVVPGYERVLYKLCFLLLHPGRPSASHAMARISTPMASSRVLPK